MGRLLRNVLYNEVLRNTLSKEKQIMGFVNDIATTIGRLTKNPRRSLLEDADW